MKTFNNYNELKEEYNKLAIELLEVKGLGEWQNEEIYMYDDLEEYAEYEVTEGWYAALGLNICDVDYNGAPNLYDFINLSELGQALSNRWDMSTHYQTNNDEVLTTGYGW